MNFSNYDKSFTTLVIALTMSVFSVCASADEVITTGTFAGASNHATTGSVSIVKTADGLNVVLGADFSFDGAPDPKVGFGTSGKYDGASQLSDLQADSGEQTYPIPESVTVGDYDEIYIWCKKYNVPLGVAKIN